MDDYSLLDLLSKTFESPRSLNSETGGDVLFLCLHFGGLWQEKRTRKKEKILSTNDAGEHLSFSTDCNFSNISILHTGLMVRDGYSPVDRHGNEVNGFKPPIDSWREHPNEWVVEYVRSDALRNFRLHCSLQPGTGRMFVHASELKERQGDPLRENIQVLGLQLNNYTDRERCRADTWEASEESTTLSVIKNERTLKEMFREFVLEPLWQNAEKRPSRDSLLQSDGSPEKERSRPDSNDAPEDRATDENDDAMEPFLNSGPSSSVEWVRHPSWGMIATGTGVLATTAVVGYLIVHRSRTRAAISSGFT